MNKIVTLLFFACLWTNLVSSQTETQSESKVQIITELGTIKIKLYNETPLHRDNFIKLTKDSFYTDLLFHRLIQGFIIQG